MTLSLLPYLLLRIEGGLPVLVEAQRYAAHGEYCARPDRQHHPAPPYPAEVRGLCRERYGWVVVLGPWEETARGWVAEVVQSWRRRR